MAVRGQRRHKDDRDILLASQLTADFQTVFLAKHDIEKNEVDSAAVDGLANLLLIAGCEDNKPLVAQMLGKHLAHVSVVIYYQKPFQGHGTVPAGWLRCVIL